MVKGKSNRILPSNRSTFSRQSCLWRIPEPTWHSLYIWNLFFGMTSVRYNIFKSLKLRMIDTIIFQESTLATCVTLSSVLWVHEANTRTVSIGTACSTPWTTIRNSSLFTLWRRRRGQTDANICVVGPWSNTDETVTFEQHSGCARDPITVQWTCHRASSRGNPTD